MPFAMRTTINANYKPKYYQGLLVIHIGTQEIGIVTKVTSKWVHVTWLAGFDHSNDCYERKVLAIAPSGTRLTVKQE